MEHRAGLTEASGVNHPGWRAWHVFRRGAVMGREEPNMVLPCWRDASPGLNGP